MPHVVLQYTANLEPLVDMAAFCKEIAKMLVAQQDDSGKPLFPTGGTRVLAFPAQNYAVADTNDDYGFCYINVRIAPGRSDAAKKATGDALLNLAQTRFIDAFRQAHVGVTIQIDESPGQVYDAKHSNLHPLFNK